MNLISKSLTRIECSPFLHPRASEIPTGKRITSPQIRFYTAAAVGGKIGSGGKRQRAKAPAKTPEVVTPVKTPEIAPVTATTGNELARPNEIAYESEVANWVNLIGFVDQPVQFEASSDGTFWAGTVISQRSGSDSSAFWYFLQSILKDEIFICNFVCDSYLKGFGFVFQDSDNI